eukprot:470030-Prymnesium_polylepis.1
MTPVCSSTLMASILSFALLRMVASFAVASSGSPSTAAACLPKASKAVSSRSLLLLFDACLAPGPPRRDIAFDPRRPDIPCGGVGGACGASPGVTSI